MAERRDIVQWTPRNSEAGSGARWLLVIGCPRSGTRSFARMLQNAGVRVGHERVGIHGTVSSYFAVDDDWYQGPHETTKDRLRDFTFEQRWLLVRNPLEVISSISFGMPDAWWDWQRRHTWIDKAKLGSLAAACEFVLDWVVRCEKSKPDWTVRIEDWKEKWPEVAERLGIAVEPLPDFSKANALHPKPRLSWDLVKSEHVKAYDGLRALASRYGYEE